MPLALGVALAASSTLNAYLGATAPARPDAAPRAERPWDAAIVH